MSIKYRAAAAGKLVGSRLLFSDGSAGEIRGMLNCYVYLTSKNFDENNNLIQHFLYIQNNSVVYISALKQIASAMSVRSHRETPYFI